MNPKQYDFNNFAFFQLYQNIYLTIMNHLRFAIYISVITLFALSSCKKEPAASFEFDQNNVKPPVTINFTNTSINAEEFLWNFGDGVTSTEENPSHEYLKGGDYEVSLKAYGEDDTNTSVKTLTILPNMTGHWNVTYVMAPNTFHGNMNLVELENHNLSGEFAMEDRGYSNISDDSRIDGFEVSIGVRLNRFMQITFEGTVNSTYDSMNGEFDYGGFATGVWSATKSK